MSLTAFNILVVLAILFSVAGIVKPQFPLVAIAVLLLSIAVLIGK